MPPGRLLFSGPTYAMEGNFRRFRCIVQFPARYRGGGNLSPWGGDFSEMPHETMWPATRGHGSRGPWTPSSPWLEVCCGLVALGMRCFVVVSFPVVSRLSLGVGVGLAPVAPTPKRPNNMIQRNHRSWSTTNAHTNHEGDATTWERNHRES